jgi:hypothetical protein
MTHPVLYFHGLMLTTRLELRIVMWFNKKFWEELIAYFPRYDTGHILTHVYVTAVTFLTNRCLVTIRGYTYRHTD